jgi:hypothetical protein
MLTKTQATQRFYLFADMLYDMVNHYDNNILILITGPLRQGKSSVALSLAMRNDPHWDMSRVVFSTRDYVHVINQHPPPGSYIIFDDAGLGVSSRRWWEEASVIFGMVAQSVGYRRYATILTVPDMNWIEKTSRTLANYVIEMVDDRKMKGWFWIRRGRSNMNLTHPSRIYPYVRLRKKINGIIMPEVKMDFLYAPPLPSEVYKEYEKIKDAVFTETYRNYEMQLEAANKPKEPKTRRISESSLMNLVAGNKKMTKDQIQAVIESRRESTMPHNQEKM